MSFCAGWEPALHFGALQFAPDHAGFPPLWYNLDMTKLLEKAIESVRGLPAGEQDAIAQIVLDELESERRWDQRFLNSAEKLRRLADAAWAEHEAGNSEPLDPGKL